MSLKILGLFNSVSDQNLVRVYDKLDLPYHMEIFLNVSPSVAGDNSTSCSAARS